MAATTAPRGNQNAGIAIAVLLHIVVIGLLSVQWTRGDRRFDNPPMEVDLVAETAPQSSAPVITEEPPAARLGEEDATDIASPEPVPTPPIPEPVVRSTPAPAPKQVARPVPTPPKKTPPAATKAPPKAAPKTLTKKPGAQPTGRPTGNLDGLGRELTKSPSKGAPAAATAAQVKKAFNASIASAVRAKWNPRCVTGVDVNKLGANMTLKLSENGRLEGFFPIEIIGKNENNDFYVQRFEECLKRAVQLAAPSFNLPADQYEYWKNPVLNFRQ